ncbi:MAG: hypothetical protein AAF515_01315 [Pseudomonadota bacterium]
MRTTLARKTMRWSPTLDGPAFRSSLAAVALGLWLLPSIGRAAVAGPPLDNPHANRWPQSSLCQAEQTAGLHDDAGVPERYGAAEFFESRFRLRHNKILMRHRTPAEAGQEGEAPALYLTLRPRGEAAVELRCDAVRGAGAQAGYACRDTPPSTLLLLNPANARFSRAAIGGWTFAAGDSADAGASEGDSLFVEYGTCRPD